MKLSAIENKVKLLFEEYKNCIMLFVWGLTVAGWILDRTYFQTPQPNIQIYNTTAEQLPPEVLSYYQHPAYKSLLLTYGRGSLRFPKSYTISTAKTGTAVLLMIQLEGEMEARAYNLSSMPTIPFSIQINRNGTRHLVTVEQVMESGVQIRTFTGVQGNTTKLLQ